MWFDKNESLYPASRVAFIFWEHARINCPEHLLRKHPNTASFVAPFLDHVIAETQTKSTWQSKKDSVNTVTLCFISYGFFHKNSC